MASKDVPRQRNHRSLRVTEGWAPRVASAQGTQGHVMYLWPTHPACTVDQVRPWSTCRTLPILVPLTKLPPPPTERKSWLLCWGTSRPQRCDGAGLPPAPDRMAEKTPPRPATKTLPRAGSVVLRTPGKARNRTPPHLTRNEGPEADL